MTVVAGMKYVPVTKVEMSPVKAMMLRRASTVGAPAGVRMSEGAETVTRALYKLVSTMSLVSIGVRCQVWLSHGAGDALSMTLGTHTRVALI